MTQTEISAALDLYIKNHEGKPVEMGGSANALNQCVDNANGWLKEGLNQPIILGANAVDFPSRISDKFVFIKNTPEGVPAKGALIVWGKPYGKYIDGAGQVVYAGHIGTFINGNAISFNSFDENWVKGDPCKIVTHVNYDGVIGWIQLKEADSETMQITKSDFSKLQGNSGKWDQTVAQLELGTDPATTPFEAAQRVIAGLKSRSVDLQNQLTIAQTAATNATDQVGRLKTQLTDEEKANSDALINEKKKTDLAVVAQGQAEGRATALQNQVDQVAKEKGAALTEAATAKVDAKNWQDKYNLLLANKARTLSFSDRLAVLFTGRIA